MAASLAPHIRQAMSFAEKLRAMQPEQRAAALVELHASSSSSSSVSRPATSSGAAKLGAAAKDAPDVVDVLAWMQAQDLSPCLDVMCRQDRSNILSCAGEALRVDSVSRMSPLQCDDAFMELSNSERASVLLKMPPARAVSTLSYMHKPARAGTIACLPDGVRASMSKADLISIGSSSSKQWGYIEEFESEGDRRDSIKWLRPKVVAKMLSDEGGSDEARRLLLDALPSDICAASLEQVLQKPRPPPKKKNLSNSQPCLAQSIPPLIDPTRHHL